MSSFVILATCARGVAPWLEAELRELGYAPLNVSPAGVEVMGNWRDVMRLNLCLATAQRVMVPVREVTARNPDELYQRLLPLPWETWLDEREPLTIASSASVPDLRDPRIVNLKAKDAIVDHLRQVMGRRPDSGHDRRGAVVFLHWHEGRCRICLDTSGESLSRRGYRRAGGAAPMQESLAAALVRASGWDGRTPFVNPMCGSGTLAIEAALWAARRAPGLTRADFAFTHLRGFDLPTWQAVRAQVARDGVGGARTRATVKPPPIVANDVDPQAVAHARANARAAGVADLIACSICDFADTPLPGAGGVVLLNPEYGHRLGDETALEATYRRIGDFFKQRALGWRGYIFTGNLALAKRVGLRTCRRLTFYNGDIECRLLEYELYGGSRRPGRQGAAAAPDASTPAADGAATGS